MMESAFYLIYRVSYQAPEIRLRLARDLAFYLSRRTNNPRFQSNGLRSCRLEKSLLNFRHYNFEPNCYVAETCALCADYNK